MRTRRFLVSPLLVYVLGQIAWMALLGLWITWYVANILSARGTQVGAAGHVAVLNSTTSVFVLGLVFLSTLLAGMTLIFISFAQQVNINRTYDNFIASVTHELKSPLASIRLHLETLALRKVDAQHAAKLVVLMVRDADRLEKLINTILDIASIEQHGNGPKLKRYSAEEIVRRTVDQTMADFRIADWHLDVEPCPGAYVNADALAFKRLFDILVDNSVKYSVGEASLRLQCAVRRGNLVIEFADRGIGIPKDCLRKVFHKFYRVERPTSPSVTGSGLGLYWAREIVRMHRGTIVAESEAERVGSLFRITIPLSWRSGRTAEEVQS